MVQFVWQRKICLLFDYTLYDLLFLDTMNSPTAFLVAVLILFTVSCVKSDNECEISDSDATIATTNAMKKCNSNIKHCFDFHKGKAVEKLYCKGMMVRLLCPLSVAFYLSLFSLFLLGGVLPPSFTNALLSLCFW